MATQVDEPLDDLLEQKAPGGDFWGRLIPIIAESRSASTAACLDLTAEEHTVGRVKTPNGPWLLINNPRISSQHAKFVSKNREAVLQDVSTNGTWVNGVRLGKGNERRLKTGDVISFINPDQGAASDAITSEETGHHVFSFIAGSASDQASGASIATTSATGGSGGDEEAEALLVSCSICQEILHRAVALQPCLHNFCGGCASKWLRKKHECPECREHVMVVARNHTLISLVEAFQKRHPSRQRSAEELAELDALDAVGSEPWQLGKKRKKSGEEERDAGNEEESDDASDDDDDASDDEVRDDDDEESSNNDSEEEEEDEEEAEGDGDSGEELEPHEPTLAEQHTFLDAARMQNFPRVRQLVRANRALVNVQPLGRWTALHQAALCGNSETVRFLLNRGANCSLLNRAGQTARQVALTRGHAACAALIVH